MIDVIIPTFRPTTYLSECFISLQRQTFSFDQFKVTVVLNGDKEPYYTDIQNLLNQFDFNYSLVYTDIAGVSNARNLGIEKTTNPYIIFLDDDDLLSDNYLEELSLLIKPDNVIVSNVFGFQEGQDSLIQDYLSFETSFQSNNLVKYRRYLSNSCCKLLPRELIGAVRFDKRLFKGEDALFMFTLSPRVLMITSTSPDVIYFRRIRPFSASRVKYSILNEFMIGLQQQIQYTSVYIRGFSKYSFLLYISRIFAVFKVVLIKIKGRFYEP